MDKVISDSFVSKYKNKKVNWGFGGLSYVVYKRTYSRLKDDGEYEEWPETIQRCINGAQKIGALYTQDEAEQLFDYIFNLKCSFGGRMLWQLGTPLVDKFCGNSLINCFFSNISSIEDFCFLFENLMMGGGVGFSVRREHIHELPKIKKNVVINHENTKDADFIVPDSRQGWVELLRKVLTSFFITGKGFNYSTILVRGYGEQIKTFGGTASGPKILTDGIEKICSVMKQRENKKLRSIDVLDICNIIGSIVVAGNLRRSAQLALGDADDYLFLRAKRWDTGNIPNWRAMSNNTICADDFSYISDMVWDGYNGNGEPYGFFNLKLSQEYGRVGEKKDDSDVVGLNPCQPSWAKLLTRNGIKQLKDVNIGDEIWSEEGWTTIVNKWSTGIKTVYRYSTTAGCFYGTENHRLVSNGAKIEAKNCESIDILCGPYRIDNIELHAQDIMDGLVIGDGSIHKASNNLIHLCIGENDYSYFDSEIKSLIIRQRPGLHDYAYEVKTSICESELPKTYNREIPDRFFYGNREKVCGFLRGLYSANGSICGNRITLKAASFKLIEQVQTMLSSIGIKSYYTTNKSSSVKFLNGEYICKESYDLNISTDRLLFYKSIGFIQDYKTEKLKNIIKNIDIQKPGKLNYDIIDVSHVSNEEVFDITVDNKCHTYWTQGCNVSNCGEITLENGGVCNLTEIFLNNISNEQELQDCAKLLYKTQKAICALNYFHEKTSKIVHKNFRIGIGVGGICQSLNKVEWLDACYKTVKKFDKEWSKQRGWPESIKITTIKPSGTISLLSGASPGVHGLYSKYFIRRVRIGSNDKLIPFCKEHGYKTEFQRNFDGTEDHNTVIVEFPCFSGTDSLIAKDISAITQLELVKKIQKVWSDNAVSCTVYYKKEELEDIKSWLKINYENNIKSISFLLHSDHGFAQAPYEEISEDVYNSLIKNIKPINTNSLESGKTLESLECVGGSCPIR